MCTVSEAFHPLWNKLGRSGPTGVLCRYYHTVYSTEILALGNQEPILAPHPSGLPFPMHSLGYLHQRLFRRPMLQETTLSFHGPLLQSRKCSTRRGVPRLSMLMLRTWPRWLPMPATAWRTKTICPVVATATLAYAWTPSPPSRQAWDIL